MTKRIVGIVCLLTVCLVGWAREVEHNFHEDSGTTPKKLTWESPNFKIGYYNDGTVYTCKNNATFAGYTHMNTTYICIKLQNNDSVIVSPARVKLTELKVYLVNAVDLAISVSTDSVTWVPIGSVGSSASNDRELYWWKITKGNYYVSIKNLSATDAYIRKIDYTLSDAPDPEPETCNCFPVVFE